MEELLEAARVHTVMTRARRVEEMANNFDICFTCRYYESMKFLVKADCMVEPPKIILSYRSCSQVDLVKWERIREDVQPVVEANRKKCRFYEINPDKKEIR